MRTIYVVLFFMGVTNVYMWSLLHHSITKFTNTVHVTQQKIVSEMNTLNNFVGTVDAAQQKFMSEMNTLNKFVGTVEATQQKFMSKDTVNPAKSTKSLFSLCRETHFFECPLIDPDLNKFPINTLNMFKKLHPEYIKINSTQFVHVWKQFQQLVIPYHVIQSNANGMFPNIDKIALFGMVQTLQPRTIVEVGAGESTKIIDATKVDAKRVIIEPYRQNEVPKKHILIGKEIQDIDVTVFDSLEEGDILFLDSSHVIMPYGDTLLELLFILPRLQKGVYVHIHDVFLPYDYPWTDQLWGRSTTKAPVYTEQWLVALMLRSNEYDVIWSSHSMVREEKSALLEMKHIDGVDYHSGSIWLKKLSASIR